MKPANSFNTLSQNDFTKLSTLIGVMCASGQENKLFSEISQKKAL
jgi:hypothetical protein